MWPFSRKKDDEPDNRPPSEAAIAVAKSIVNEPMRWNIAPKNIEILVHDSTIEVNIADGWIRAPWIDEPDADSDLLIEAGKQWVALRVTLPAVEAPKP